MPKRTVIDHVKLGRILEAQYHVITRSQVLDCGVPESTVSVWVRPSGKWQKMLPGVYLALTGTPTVQQRHMAVQLYSGSTSVITGSAAIRTRRLRVPPSERIDTLIPWSVKRQNAGFARVHRTRHMPSFYRIGPIRYAITARAVADAAHWFTNLDDVRALVAEAVQRQACSIAELGIELARGANTDSSRLRTALSEVRSGVRSAAEAQFRERVLRSDLPVPQFNMVLRATDGTSIGEVDAWWADAGVAAEIDSQEYHFYRDGWLKTDAKHSRMLKHDIKPHHFAPARITSDWPGVYAELKASINSGLKRPRLNIIAIQRPG
ncbi:MAG: hypothetical protein ACRDOI_46880 [Trebonia sp.]